MHSGTRPHNFLLGQAARRGGRMRTTMKSITMILACAGVALFVGTRAASSQEVCLKAYAACMDACAERSAKSVQDTCINNCQAGNNRCSERVFGGHDEPG